MGNLDPSLNLGRIAALSFAAAFLLRSPDASAKGGSQTISDYDCLSDLKAVQEKTDAARKASGWAHFLRGEQVRFAEEESRSLLALGGLAPSDDQTELNARAMMAHQRAENARADAENNEKFATSTTEARRAAEAHYSTCQVQKLTTVSDSGLSSQPQWDLLASAMLSSVDTSKPQLAIGFQYASPWTLLRVFLRKDVSSSSVEANQPDINTHEPDRSFGEAILNPGLANVGFLLRGEVSLAAISYDTFGAPHVQCSGPSGICVRSQNGVYNNVSVRRDFRVYAESAVARSTFSAKDPQSGSSTSSFVGVPIAFDLGLLYRLEGLMPGGNKIGGSGLLAISPYVGLASRVLAGDPSDNKRFAVYGSNAGSFFGMEFGVGGQLGSAMFDLRTTILGPTRDFDQRVPGVTGGQLTLNVLFSLPWNVVGKPESATSATE